MNAKSSRIRLWPGFLAGTLIALIAFLLSFDALQSLFMECGASPWLAWGGPICIDGTILLSTWAVWGFERNNIRYRWYPWAGFIVAGLLSILGNALHAWIRDGGLLPAWAGPMVMAIPPIALMYSTHLIVIVAGSQTTMRQTAETVTEDTQAPTAAVPAAPSPQDRIENLEEWYMHLEAARRVLERSSDADDANVKGTVSKGRSRKRVGGREWSQSELFESKDSAAA